MGQSLGSDETVENESFGSRMVGALAGMCIGIIMFLVSPAVLGWNEFDFVRNQAVIWTVHEKAQKAGCEAGPGLAGQPIWLAGCKVSQLHNFADHLGADVKGLFRDEASLHGVKLIAESDIYQWQESKSCSETKNSLGGGTTKKCKWSYRKGWSSKPVTFEGPNPDGHHNVGEIRGLTALNIRAPEYSARIGSKDKSYSLSQALTEAFGARTMALKPSLSKGTLVQGLRVGDVRSGSWVEGGEGTPRLVSTNETNEVLFGKGSFSSPEIGDVRTRFQLTGGEVGKTTLSVVGRQEGAPPDAKLGCWNTGKGGSMAKVCWAFPGSYDLDEMELRKHDEAGARCFWIRILGWLAMFIGLNLIFGPCALAPDLVPCVGPMVGDVVGCALCCVSLLVSSALSLLVIGIAWCMARPLIGGLMLGGGALMITCAVATYIRCRRERGEDVKFAEATPAYGAAVTPPPPYQRAADAV